MITKAEMMPLLLEAYRPFGDEWAEWLKESGGGQADVSVYGALSAFAHQVISLLDRGDQAALKRIFSVVERFHLEGDSYVREAATIGLLEDLQNAGIHSQTTPAQFRSYLGEESLRAWDKLEEFWEGDVAGE